MVRRIWGLVLILAVGACSAANALADDLHYNNILIGDRASNMGGAYTAVSDDATGLYYNPAGIVYSAGRSVSANVNGYNYSQKTYKEVIGGNGWVRNSAALLPNYFGVVMPMGEDYKIGFSYALPDSITSDQEQTFHDLQLSAAVQPFNPGVTITSYLINFNEESNTYNIGPSIAKEFSDTFSAGLTLYYYQRKTLRILNQIIKTSNGGSEQSTDFFHSTESGVRPVLGFMWSLPKNVAVGLALSKVFIAPTANLGFTKLRIGDSKTTFHTSDQRVNIAQDSDPTHNTAISLPAGPSNSDAKRTTPKQMSLGVAWFPSSSLLLSADLNFYTAKSVGDIVQFKASSEPLADVVNVALGTEYYITKNWAARAGFYTDFANTPKIVEGGINQAEHIDNYGVTASISHFTRNTSVTLGTGFTYGTGQAQIIGDSTSIQKAESRGWMINLSSTYAY
ncbi:MAG: OmpP1/FadL family transporter [Nitrospirota bacterium]